MRIGDWSSDVCSSDLPRASHDAGWRREERATDDAAADDVFAMTTLDRSTLGAIGFGAAPLGNLYRPLTDAAARATIRAAWDAGIRYFDTAPHYGFGLSEKRLGAALAEIEDRKSTRLNSRH